MKKIILSFLTLSLILGLIVVVSAAAGDELNVPQHTWAPGHASNSNPTIQMKWGLTAGTYDGYAVTICDSTWTSINGEAGYIDYSCHAHGQFFCIWKNDNRTGNIAPTTAEFTATGGYLAGSAGGRLLEGHVVCPPPPECGNGTVEGGTPMFPAEECDDGNVDDGDGCSSTCQIEGKIASLQHLWDVGHGSNPHPTLYMKWGCNAFPDVANKCDQYGDTRPVTICGTPWDSVNGLAVNLIPEAPGSERFKIYDLTSGNTDATEVVGGYTNEGFIMEGDVLCLGEVPPDTTPPEITFVEPEDESIQSGTIHLKATCDEVCNYINFWWRAEGEQYSSASKRYHYVHEDGTVFEWDLNTLDAQKADNTTYLMEDGKYYLYAAGKDLAGNWARTPEIQVEIDNITTKAEALMRSGVPGKGLENASGLQKPFNPKSKADEHAGKK